MIRYMMRYIFSCLLFLACTAIGQTPKSKTYTVSSPDGSIRVYVNVGEKMAWSVAKNNQPVITSSGIALQLGTGEVIGNNAKVTSSAVKPFSETIIPVAYKKDRIVNGYNQLLLRCKTDYDVEFRVYDDGAAYRFVTHRPGEMEITNEVCSFNFDRDYSLVVPYVNAPRKDDKYSCSFESFYAETSLSKLNKDTLAYLPLLVKLQGSMKAVILEADVQDYPGLFVQPAMHDKEYSMQAVFAPYPIEEGLAGYNGIVYQVKKRAGYIAAVQGSRNFPWRVVVVSASDKELLNSDMVQKLSEPCKIENTSWIKPGKVAWDWWNDWNISKVDFKAGINTITYKYYIDFAAANHLEYVVLDEGWSDDWDLNKLNSNINLPELVAYARQKNVGIILWSTWYAITRNADALFAKYAEMGVKGFKIDFFDRDDQKVMSSIYELASLAAKHQLLIDYHGIFRPQGLQRTWPNVVNFEGVRGMEYMKWNADERVPQYEVTIPFIRMMAGPLDYTPGAMRNATKGNVQSNSSMPLSAGTRCHQMALYVLYEGALQMLSDNPTAYMKEQECTDFIAAIPVVYNNTLALDGSVGDFAVIARQNGASWWVSGITNWNERDVTIDFSFLPSGNYEAEIFRDGMNANKDATDYKKEKVVVDNSSKLNIHLASGGGFVMRVSPR